MALQFNIEPVAKGLFEQGQTITRQIDLAIAQRSINHAIRTTGQADQARLRF